MRDTPMNYPEKILWSDVLAVLIAGLAWMQFEKFEEVVAPAEGVVGSGFAFLVCASILLVSVCVVWTVRTAAEYVLSTWRTLN